MVFWRLGAGGGEVDIVVADQGVLVEQLGVD